MTAVLGSYPRSMPAQLAMKLESSQGLLRYRNLQRTSDFNRQKQLISRRFIGSQRAGANDGWPFTCTWLTTTPEELILDDVVPSASTLKSKISLDYIPVFLVTSSLAHWIDPGHPFLDQWMNRAYGESLRQQPETPAHAITAVVDRLPHKRSTSDNIGDKALVTEVDGISVLLVKAKNVQGKPREARQVRSMETEESALIFSFQNNTASIPGTNIHRGLHEIGLRLANTIFINGKESTLFGTRWTWNSALNKLNLEQTADFSKCMININPEPTKTSLELPLHPVGQRRKVISGMGNILRQVAKDADGKSNDPMPASSELEKVLPRYISENNIPGQRVSVWALIETFEESPSAQSSYPPGTLSMSIKMGGKLHRVMSGGGGWGKKQGLLSLDPETNFLPAGSNGLSSLDHVFLPRSERPDDEAFFPPEKSVTLGDLATLSQAAQPGDYVQFFASVEPNCTQWDHSDLPEPHKAGITCVFGVVSDAEICQAQAAPQKDLTIIPNYFGALSEKSITYLQPVVRSEEISESQTKLDIPGSRVEILLK